MTVFMVLAAVLLAAALLFVIPPLLHRQRGENAVARNAINITVYRDQLAELERDLENDIISKAQYEVGRVELERRLLEDVETPAQNAATGSATATASMKTALVVGILLPIFAIGGYFYFGEPDAIDPRQAIQQQMSQMSESDVNAQINRMVEQLAQRLEADPLNAEGWKMLGRSYIVLRRFDDALAALENAVRLKDDDAQLLADYADALAMAGGESLEGRPMALIRRALELDPKNQKALWLAGTAAYERADFKQALEYWKRLYALVPKDSDAARTMESNIAESESLLAAQQQGRESSPADEVQGGGVPQVTGVATLDPVLRDRVADQDTVYIFARPPQGSRMPVAIIRAQVKDLPLSFTLDDSKAMNPAMSLSQFARVEVVARVSRTGNAMPSSGDLQGSAGVVNIGDSAQVVIDEVLP